MNTIRLFFLSCCLLMSFAAFANEPAAININTADAQTLTQLTGIGEKKAQAIVAYRDANGAFKAVEELTAVKGIGEAILRDNRERIVLN